MASALRILAKDFGAALAVLSLYFLMLLAPLHQAQATQDAFDALGYASTPGWSLCISGDPVPQDGDGLPPLCPVAGLGKFELAPSGVPAPDFAVSDAHAIAFMHLDDAAPAQAGYAPLQARAPPVVA